MYYVKNIKVSGKQKVQVTKSSMTTMFVHHDGPMHSSDQS